MIVLPKIESCSLKEIQQFQWEHLKESLQYAYENSDFYQKLWDSKGTDISQVNDFDSFSSLPFTTKQDLQINNDAFFCIPKEKVIDWITTSGTMGKPVSFALSQKDIERLGYNEALSYIRCGIDQNDVIQITTTIDKRFMAGLAYYEGAKQLGAGVVRMGPGAMGLQWDSIKRFSTTVLIGVPSFILKMKEFAISNNIDFSKSSVKKIICIGEPIRDEQLNLNHLGKKIKQNWDIEIFSTYASTEMATAFTECNAGQGGHLHSELAFIEVLDKNNHQVTNGQLGEIVYTALQTEAMPLVRFRTGDMVRFYDEPCSCGSNSPRLGPVIGRKKHLLKFKGTSLYPLEIINILEQSAVDTIFVLEINEDQFNNDVVTLRIDGSSEDVDQLKLKFKTNLRVSPEILIDTPLNIQQLRWPNGSRKPQTIIDKRLNKQLKTKQL